MLLLGLILLAGTAAFTGLLIADNIGGGPHYTASMLGNHIATLNMLGAFLVGIVLTLVFCLGLAMLTGGAAHHRRRGADLKAARRSAAQAAAERDELAARIQAGQASQTQTAPMPAAARPEQEPVRATAGNGHGHRHRIHLFGH
ncbi:hypothetical protein NGB36_05185 [Streptomyces sp. RB6PN25]|uniref:Integral membrane protein n=1 Tax=Streptomyces humicola TaxID=2953240 RepID=A0ABT1PU04_9ACTN|nr:hypothetical protein [Streptomyces humicola]MCQ4080000.1 hypothetical protein [Streptomyces humicola]